MPHARLLCLALAGLTVALPGTPAAATVFTTTTTQDIFDGACDAHCSLRDAIAAANAAPGADEVRLAAGVYTLIRQGPDEEGGLTGDLDVRGELKLVGAGARVTAIDGADLDRILDLGFQSVVEISDLTLRNGHARGEGNGGAILSHGESARILRCHIDGNAASGEGGGVYNSAQLEIRDTTISGNTAQRDGGGIAAALGFLELSNVTISGNEAVTGGGGAIFGHGFSPIASIDSSTITDNSAPIGGGILAVAEVPEVEISVEPVLRNTILAGNHTTGSPECGVALDGARNLIGRTTGCEATLPPSLGLAPLADNGGPAPTHALLPGSAAIDAGPATAGTAGCAAQDERGEPRPADGNGDGSSRCDIGAFEKAGATLPCAPGETALCLGGRFRVTAQWTRPDGVSGAAHAVAMTADAGYLWFFNPANVEVIVKSIDACATFDRFWIFLAGLTNVEVEVQVEDTRGGTVKTYRNEQGTPFAPIYDTSTFATCP